MTVLHKSLWCSVYLYKVYGNTVTVRHCVTALSWHVIFAGRNAWPKWPLAVSYTVYGTDGNAYNT